MDLNQFFHVVISKDKLECTIDVHTSKFLEAEVDDTLDELKQNIDREKFIAFLNEHEIIFGIKDEVVDDVIEKLHEGDYPKVIAEGVLPQSGLDGDIEYHVNLNTKVTIKEDEQIDFKEMMKIPTVEPGDRLVSFIAPTKGEDGTNIHNEPIPAKPGKVVSLKAGENTKLDNDSSTIYSTNSGQVSLTEKKILVLPIYEVNDSLDMKIGNIDFNGSIVIKGDVPNGFNLKARGDITIYGLVEAANLEAGSSIFIREGVSAQGKGFIKAGVDIQVGNINQGNVEAGRNLMVENSILHSEVIAREIVYCQRGNVIGGSTSAGKRVQGKDVGNRMNTKTFIYLGENKKVLEIRSALTNEIEELKDQVNKLTTIGESLEKIKLARDLTSKERITYLRQRNSLEIAEAKLKELEEELNQYLTDDDQLEVLKLSATGIIYPNVQVISGKYSRSFNKEQKYVSIVFRDNDFTVSPL
ncbi:hypothetical protein CEY16_02500 [Halalkalibacillus sediminis]|uniref:Flagellar Assembly Protein A N-terminal region domain-containing protein n=1 Tax=Halalkalibacillus sediminis TaxID=2018042 RepID=A0A2I0QWC5_9BACI|nr:FapA family protein [Halalkalibacillus sediminis]PKR78646.1 hypothetical protein CEY16_02500 [Halalkalibacillus sediminis]